MLTANTEGSPLPLKEAVELSECMVQLSIGLFQKLLNVHVRQRDFLVVIGIYIHAALYQIGVVREYSRTQILYCNDRVLDSDASGSKNFELKQVLAERLRNLQWVSHFSVVVSFRAKLPSPSGAIHPANQTLDTRSKDKSQTSCMKVALLCKTPAFLTCYAIWNVDCDCHSEQRQTRLSPGRGRDYKRHRPNDRKHAEGDKHAKSDQGRVAPNLWPFQFGSGVHAWFLFADGGSIRNLRDRRWHI